MSSKDKNEERVVCGHVLGKRWYLSLKNRVECHKIILSEWQSIKEDFLHFSYLKPKDDPKTKEALLKIDETINKEKEMIIAEKKNLEMFTNAIKSLPEREAKFCRLHYIEGKTISETAEIMAYTFQSIHRIKDIAIEGIMKYLNE